MIVIMFAALATFPGRDKALAEGAHLFHRGDRVRHMILVLSGEVRLVRHQPDGRVVILQRAKARSVAAEASLFSNAYHCDGIAVGQTSVRLIDRSLVRRRFEADPGFASLWVGHLASEIRDARLRSEILSLKRVGERLDAWLAWHEALPAKGDWKNVAAEIGVSPEALYREIARRGRRPAKPHASGGRDRS